MKKDFKYGIIKKRILDALFEYSYEPLPLEGSDTGLQLYADRLATAVSTSLVRMYESLPEGKKKAFLTVNCIEGDLCKLKKPTDFSRLLKLSAGGRNVPLHQICEDEEYIILPSSLIRGVKKVGVVYRLCPPEVTNETSDDFILSLSSLGAEALVCLAASEICREDDSALYTRFLYKYSDFVEGFFGVGERAMGRNSFYKTAERRW